MKTLPVLYALLAAVCYGISVPLSKLLLAGIPSALLAALLYLGAGLGMAVVTAARSGRKERAEARLSKADLPYTVAMVVLDIAAPLCLLFGLAQTTAETASLLGNFEIAATSVIALFVFREAIGRRMWVAIALITVSSVLLSVEDFGRVKLSSGALLVLAACVCWGVENNCTGRLSLKNPLQIVLIKGIGSGCGALLIAWLTGGAAGVSLVYVPFALALGFVAYGLSIYFYILAQRGLGAARTSAFYAVAPFVGVALSFAVFREVPGISFFAALALMAGGAYLTVSERHAHRHSHAELAHEHRHRHDDGHHGHSHGGQAAGEHSHPHLHGAITHLHPHTPDQHHSHTHE
ncbi:MAG: DMT family transporter [Clostridiales Family XIII bacterium]|jgi:drug/metabolite transporter (DMT)-like permease|nr:DMT family transporter [Clostridiales Family XIII bacterium]